MKVYQDKLYKSNTYDLGSLIIDAYNAPTNNRKTILTHTHPDHYKYKNLQGAVYATTKGREYLTNPVKAYDEMLRDEIGLPLLSLPKVLSILRKPLGLIVKLINNKRIKNLQFLEEQEVNLTIYEVGGHSPDTILILYKANEKVLFTGDAMHYGFDSLSFKTRDSSYTDSIKALEKIIELEPDVLMPGHGEPLRGREEIKTRVLKIKNETEQRKDLIINLWNQGKSMKQIRKELGLKKRGFDSGYGEIYAVIKEFIFLKT